MGSESTRSPGTPRSVRFAAVVVLGLVLAVLVVLGLVVETNYRPASWRDGILTLEKKRDWVPGTETRTRRCELSSLRPALEREGAFFLRRRRYPFSIVYHRDAASQSSPLEIDDSSLTELFSVGPEPLFRLRSEWLEDGSGFGPKTLDTIRNQVPRRGAEFFLPATPNLENLLSDLRSVVVFFGGR